MQKPRVTAITDIILHVIKRSMESDDDIQHTLNKDVKDVSRYRGSRLLCVVTREVFHVLHAPGKAYNSEGEHDVCRGPVRHWFRRTESHDIRTTQQ
jgi:hypothetical protein